MNANAYKKMDVIGEHNMMTRFEVARIVGIRAMQLSEGADVLVDVTDVDIRTDYTYLAALELYHRKLDVCVTRGSDTYHVSELIFPPELPSMLNSRDGKARRNMESIC